jgi:nucleotide-binding universal stress UspA family protein
MRAPWRRKDPERRPGQPRLLIPFTDRQLDETVLDAALRIARAQDSVLVPAYLMVVPLEYSLDAPVHKDELSRAMPILEAVELAARRAGVPVDARIERGRSAIDALSRLWDVESFDRVVIPAPAPGRSGFTSQDLTWMLANAPGEVIVLRPAPNGDGAVAAGTGSAATPSR